VITTRGPHTPSELDKAVMFCENPEDALAAATFLASNPEPRAKLVHQAHRYARQFAWERIADLHGALYRQLLHIPSQRDAPRLGDAKNQEERLLQK
jgi:hypothetical protein